MLFSGHVCKHCLATRVPVIWTYQQMEYLKTPDFRIAGDPTGMEQLTPDPMMTMSADAGRSGVDLWSSNVSHRTPCSQYDRDCPFCFGKPVQLPSTSGNAWSLTLRTAGDSAVVTPLADADSTCLMMEMSG